MPAEIAAHLALTTPRIGSRFGLPNGSVHCNRWRDAIMYASRLLNRRSAFFMLIAATGTAFAAGQAPAAESAKHAVAEHAKGPSDAELIASAMKAAPAKVAKNATIVAMQV